MRMTRSAALATVLGVAGLVVAVLGIRSGLESGPAVDQAAPPAVSATAGESVAPAAPVSPGSADGSAAGPAQESVRRSDASLSSSPAVRRTPVRLAIGPVDLDLPVRPVGVAADGQMELPASPSVLGWYRFGAYPGPDQPGSAVVAGHLDSRRYGLGPLVRLRDVEVGDPVRVVSSDGRVEAYVVTQVQRFDRQGLPPEIFARTGPNRLRVITCGGEYLPDAGGYQQNLVVTAVPA